MGTPEVLSAEPVAEQPLGPSTPSEPSAPLAEEPAPVTEEPTTEGQPEPQAETEPPAIPWSQIADPQEVLSHEAFKPHLEERDKATQKRVRAETQKQLQPLAFKSTQAQTALAGKLDPFWRAIDKAGKAGTLTAEEISEAAGDSPDMWQALAGSLRNTGYWSAVGITVGNMLVQAEAQGEWESYQPRLEAVRIQVEEDDRNGVPGEQRQNHDPELFSDLLETVTEARVKKAVDEARTKWDKEQKTAVEVVATAAANNAARTGQKPPAEPKGGGAGGGATWSTKVQARTLHVQDKITNAEMKRINADPSIPEM